MKAWVLALLLLPFGAALPTHAKGPCDHDEQAIRVAGVGTECAHDHAPHDAPIFAAAMRKAKPKATLPPSCGSDGPRIKVIHFTNGETDGAHDAIRAAVAQIEGYVEAVADGQRVVRWDQPDCQLRIDDVDGVRADGRFRVDWGEEVQYLQNHGYDPQNHANWKLLVFSDSAAFCAVGTVIDDENPNPKQNKANLKPTYALLGWGCWSGSLAAHELMHGLGAVQDGAPHSSLAHHCYEGDDIMCYNDNGPYYRNGGQGLTTCPGYDGYDCGRDDYFNVTPPPDSYLATHWNTANSRFLQSP